MVHIPDGMSLNEQDMVVGDAIQNLLVARDGAPIEGSNVAEALGSVLGVPVNSVLRALRDVRAHERFSVTSGAHQDPTKVGTAVLRVGLPQYDHNGS